MDGFVYKDSVYNFDITKSDYTFKICLDYYVYDNAEHTFNKEGGVSPGVVSIPAYPMK